MPRLYVKLYTQLKERAGQSTVPVEGRTIPECLRQLCDHLGTGGAELLFNPDGSVRASYQVCLNTRMLDNRKLETVEFSEGDTLHLMPPIAGGACQAPDR